MTSAKSRDLLQALTDLSDVLQRLPNLDSKLADYVFFPLSHVFSRAAALSSNIIAAAISCLQLMLEKDWRVSEEIDLFTQLLILLSNLLARGSADGEDHDLSKSVLDCLITLFRSARRTSCPIQAIGTEKMTTIIGQILFTTLAIAKENPTVMLQKKALTALQNYVFGVNDTQIWRTFFPGIVSQLTKILQPTSQHRRNSKVLVLALAVLSALLEKTLFARNSTPTEEEQTRNSESSIWAQATSPQLLLVLAKISKLQFHEKPEVREALCKFCFSMVEDHGHMLPDCQSASLEIVITTFSREIHDAMVTYDHLSRLVLEHSRVKACCENLYYKWVSSLPRHFQSTDSAQIECQVSRIKIAYQALLEAGFDPAPLCQALAPNFKDCVGVVLNSQAKQSIAPVDALALNELRDLDQVTNRRIDYGSRLNPPALVQASALQSLEDLLFTVHLTKAGPNFEGHFANSVLAASRESKTVSLWILARLLDAETHSSSEISKSSSLREHLGMHNDYVDPALNQALEILSSSSEDDTSDTRAEYMSLEILTILAQLQGEYFRSTLMDTLYPIMERLGSSEPTLRDYTIRCLDYIAYACGYRSCGDMIVQNVDYLVNAIAINLTSSDIDPQAPQVLVMMLETSGPSLIPYLDDTLESVFGILASFHGYSRLVDSLFSFLSSMVKMAKLSPASLEKSVMEHRKEGTTRLAVYEVIRMLDQIDRPPASDTLLDATSESVGSSERDHTKLGGVAAVNEDESIVEYSGQESSGTSKIYSTIQSVLRLSQFYLTREEPYLRRRLLDLVATGCPYLSTNQDEFLPLVNDIWPVTVQRLYDEETFVTLAAMQALSELFKGAGDFLASRIEDEWHNIQRLYQQLEKKATTMGPSKANVNSFAHATQAFEGIVGMLVDLTYHVRLTSEMEDDIFTMLGTVARSQPNVRDALQRLNEDALWLVLDLSSFDATTPSIAGHCFQAVVIG